MSKFQNRDQLQRSRATTPTDDPPSIVRTTTAPLLLSSILVSSTAEGRGLTTMMMHDEEETTLKEHPSTIVDGGKLSPGPASTRRDRQGVEFALTAEHIAAAKVSNYQSGTHLDVSFFIIAAVHVHDVATVLGSATAES